MYIGYVDKSNKLTYKLLVYKLKALFSNSF
jgi:hypothetical protein